MLLYYIICSVGAFHSSFLMTRRIKKQQLHVCVEYSNMAATPADFKWRSPHQFFRLLLRPDFTVYERSVSDIDVKKYYPRQRP